VPVPRDQLLAGLAAGRGDLAAGSITVTDARAHSVAFGTPFLRGVRELLVSGPAAPALGTGTDALAGQAVTVRRSSSYHEHLEALNATLAARGRPPVTLTAADERLEDEALLELVSAGVLPWAVVDDFAAGFWAKVLPGLRVHEDIVIHADGQVAWAMRPGSPELAAEVDRFVRRYARGTLLGNVVLNRYLAGTRFVTNPASQRAQSRFDALLADFTRSGMAYDLDPLMLVAQGYQESGLDQARRSARGAVGVMQLLPATAAAPPIGIRGIDRDAARNIEAAAKYLDHLRRTYVDAPGISDADRLLLAFAAYNAGPGNLRRFRQAAAQRGLDPNVWFGNVEVGAAHVVGRETVDYVGNIVKYYVAYRLAVERGAEQQAARQALPAPRR
jgi:membrane-bound lytic murein transglycosylase MltF